MEMIGHDHGFMQEILPSLPVLRKNTYLNSSSLTSWVFASLLST